MFAGRLLGIALLGVCVVLAGRGGMAQQAHLCPTTASSQPAPFFAPAPYSQSAPFQHQFWYGTDALWTMLREDGRWGAVYRPDQAVYTNKVFVWRQGYDSRAEPKPPLTLTARRLDGHAPPVVVTDSTHASAADIGTAMLTLAHLPTGGCWEMTARYRGQALTFVTLVP